MPRFPSTAQVAGALGALALAAATLLPGAIAGARGRAMRAAKASGTFTVDFANSFPTLDPVRWEDAQSQIPMQAIYQTLVTYAFKSTKIVPDAAKSWSVSRNGLVYTFHLYPHLKFSNGDPLTAQDVVDSINRVTAGNAAGPEGAAPYGSAYDDIVGYNAWFNNGKAPPKGMSGMKGLTAPNATTVVFHLVTPQAYFLNELALESAVIVDPSVVSKYGLANYQLHAVGSGPFELIFWHRNHQMELKPNPNYSGPNPAKLAKVVFNVNVPYSTQFLYFKQGKVDMIWLPDQGTYLSALSTPGMMKDFYKNPTNEIWYYAFNITKPPFNKLKVREAVNYAINRRPDLRLVNGLASVMTQPLPPEMPGYQKNLKPYPYNVKLAKKLLAEAGYPHGFTITLIYTSGRPFVQNVTENVQAQLAKIGIKANLKDIAQTGAYWPYEDNPKNPFQMAWTDWYQDYPDPEDFMFDLLNGANVGATDVGGFNNATFNSLVNKADALPVSKQAERLKLYDQAQKIELKQMPWVPMFYPIQDAFVQSWVYPHNVNAFIHPVRGLVLQDISVKH